VLLQFGGLSSNLQHDSPAAETSTLIFSYSIFWLLFHHTEHLAILYKLTMEKETDYNTSKILRIETEEVENETIITISEITPTGEFVIERLVIQLNKEYSEEGDVC
jgi:hypothetical protein